MGAYAIVGDPGDTSTWKLPHHTKAIFRSLKGKLDIEKTVDWDRMGAAVAALSPGGSFRITSSPDVVLAAAQHLAAHFRTAERPLPDALAVLV